MKIHFYRWQEQMHQVYLIAMTSKQAIEESDASKSKFDIVMSYSQYYLEIAPISII